MYIKGIVFVLCAVLVDLISPQSYGPPSEIQIPVNEIPQIVYFAYDDAVTSYMASFYDKIFTEERQNPNGCRMKMSLFISHDYTDYRIVKQYYDQGHEVAVHSVTHSVIDTGEKLQQEAFQQRENLKNAGIAPEDIMGWRSPFLKTAGVIQPEILKSLNYLYDISLTYTRVDLSDPKPWPLTMENGWPYACGVPPCPLDVHVEDFWEVPVNSVLDYKGFYPCVFVDGCNIPPNTEQEAYNFLWNNFLSYYNTTRAPFGLHMHAAWFAHPAYEYRVNAMIRFLSDLMGYDDVYVVTVKQMLDWMTQPTPVSQIHTLQSWQCAATTKPKPTTTTTAATTTTPTTTTTSTITTTPTMTTMPTTTTIIAAATTTSTTATTAATTTTTPTTTNTTPTPTTTTSITTTASENRPDTCIQDVTCFLPSCFCAGTDIPGGLSRLETPQMVVVTLDGWMDQRISDVYEDIFKDRENPNGCRARGTVFATEFSKPSVATKLVSEYDAEIALKGSIDTITSHKGHNYVNASGWRTQTLNLGGNEQFRLLQETDALYDSTLTLAETNTKMWPFTLDFGCVFNGCPSEVFNGLWEVPLNRIMGYQKQYPCVYADGCFFNPPTEEDTEAFLMAGFEKNYNSNRAPFGLHLGLQWFSHYAYEHNVEGLRAFLDTIMSMKDVYLVSASDVIQWIKGPTPLDSITQETPWNC